MTSYQVVCRVEPIKSAYALRGCEHHQKRLAPLKSSVDPARERLNQTLFGTDDFVGDVMAVVGKYKKAHSKSSLAAEMILTANSDWFNEISPQWKEGIYTEKFQEWVDLNLKFLKEKYPGLAHVKLHLDEDAPHFHAFIVPVSTKLISYRRGSHVATRIRYNDVFGDDMSVIVEARRTKNSELTKLGRLQTEYALAMKPTGLIRGIMNANVDHETIADYQKRLAGGLPGFKTLPPAPVPTLQDRTAEKIGIPTAYAEEKAKYQAEASAVRRHNDQVIKTAFVKAQETDKLAKENQRLRNLLVEKDEKLAEQGAQIRELDSYKALSAEMRGLDMKEIAKRIEYDGDITWKNAIDMVKELGGFNYDESIAWLYNEFGEAAAKATAVAASFTHAKVITEKKPERPLTKSELTTAAAATRQLNAIGADKYRITLFNSDEEAFPDLRTYNMGKASKPDQEEKFYTKEDITAMIPFLRRENTRGYNIFITPFSAENNYVLVDDLTNETLPAFTAAGYQPNLLLSSSAKKMQAVFVLPKRAVAEPARNALFNELNGKYGDPKITGYVHPFRLAGFTNAKPKHVDANGLRPFVRVLNIAQATCTKAVAWCQAFMEQTNVTAVPKPRRGTVQQAVDNELQAALSADPEALPSDRASNVAKQFYEWIAIRYADQQPDGPDYSRADWMLCNRMQASFSQEDIGRAIWNHSPGIAQRHPDVMRYVNGTLTNNAIHHDGSMRPG